MMSIKVMYHAANQRTLSPVGGLLVFYGITQKERR